MAILPNFITQGTGLTLQMQYFLGGTSVLIVVGVALELVDKLQAQLVMKNYGEAGQDGGGANPAWAKTEGRSKASKAGGAKAEGKGA